MRRQVVLGAAAVLVASFAWAVSSAMPGTTTFTYQGQLKQSGVSVNNTCDVTGTLWNAGTGGSIIAGPQTVPNISVVNGLFAVVLDFGASAFVGAPPRLEIAVRCPAGGGDFVTLAPRQPITAAPYAIQTRGVVVDDAGNVGIGTDSPDAKLDVVFNAPTDDFKAVEFEFTGAGGSGVDFFRNSVQNGRTPRRFRIHGGNDYDPYPSFGLGMVTNHPLRFFTNDSERVRIAEDGNVGIGTTGPREKLEVNGKLRVGNTQVWDNEINRYASTSDLYIQMRDASDDSTADVGNTIINANSGNVGIGTASPSRASAHK